MEVRPCGNNKAMVDPTTGLEIDCGNGPHRQDCPVGSYCHITLNAARCCPKSEYYLNTEQYLFQSAFFYIRTLLYVRVVKRLFIGMVFPIVASGALCAKASARVILLLYLYGYTVVGILLITFY